MLLARWIARMVADVVRVAVVNRSPVLGLGLMLMLALALTMVAAQVAAPFVYTLF